MTAADGRAAALAAVAARLPGSAAERAAAAERRLAERPRGPGLAHVAAAAKAGTLAETFCAAASASGATVLRTAGAAASEAAIRKILAEHAPAGPVVRADLPRFAGLDDRPGGAHAGAAQPEDAAGVTRAAAGIAETGSVVLASDPETPTSLNFLPAIHIVTLSAAAIHAGLDDALAALRGPGRRPRTVNLITGPSRTGDIELTLQVGVHGPRAIFILVEDDD
ncbi:LutC/YkgG family protein [Oleispirillum naphthae]|uniref:LutC/YkgG family protein n=1 Tax=Oleispirillum naphthae TaxID=2838853 RepID=UPI0030826990